MNIIIYKAECHLSTAFQNFTNIEIMANYNAEDIRHFIKNEVVKHANWKEMSNPLQERIIQVLSERSDGM